MGLVFPKVSSETKTAPTIRSTSAIVRPRATKSKGFFASFSIKSLVPFAAISAIAFIIVMIGVHLYMVNAYSGKGFELRRHQSAINKLVDDQKHLMVQQAEMGSIMKVSEVATEHKLVPITHEEFLTTNQLTQR